MERRDYRQDIEGYDQVLKEIDVLKKYGTDYSVRKGIVSAIVERLHPARLHLRVSEIRDETPTAKTIRLVSRDGALPPFQAGQYINVFVTTGGTKTSRPYSISSSPSQRAFYDITVRRVDRGFVSNYILDGPQVGDSLESTSPSGNFYYNPLFHGKDLVFLAGGSGITPFMSMIREVTDRGLDRSIHLVYGSRKLDDIIFHDELKDRARRHSQFRLSHVISEPDPGYAGHCGLISADLLKTVLGDVSGKMFYLCGPEVMYLFCREELRSLQIPERRIRTEMYGPPADVSMEPGWPAAIDKNKVFQVSIQNGPTIPALAGEPLMVSLEKAGLAVAASCRSGECSLCRTKMLSGKVFHPQSVRIRRSDVRFGYVHPCVAYPVENLEILL